MSEPRFPPGQDIKADPEWIVWTAAIVLGVATAVVPIMFVLIATR